MRKLTKWISKRYSKVRTRNREQLEGFSGATADEAEEEREEERANGGQRKGRNQPEADTQEEETNKEDEKLNSDELWLSTLPRRRHPLGFVLAPSRAYAQEPSKDTRWIEQQNSVMYKMWPVFLSVIIDLFVNAYTEPVYSSKRTVHALVFSCQICSLLLTVTSFVVLVGGDSASMTQADYYLRLLSEFRLMLLFCLLNVLAMCSSRILKLVLLFENYPHAEISRHAGYRGLYATHQIVSTLYYVALVQSVFSICKKSATTLKA